MMSIYPIDQERFDSLPTSQCLKEADAVLLKTSKCCQSIHNMNYLMLMRRNRLVQLINDGDYKEIGRIVEFSTRIEQLKKELKKCITPLS